MPEQQHKKYGRTYSFIITKLSYEKQQDRKNKNLKEIIQSDGVFCSFGIQKKFNNERFNNSANFTLDKSQLTATKKIRIIFILFDK